VVDLAAESGDNVEGPSPAKRSGSAASACGGCRTRRARCRCTPASCTPCNLVNLLLLMSEDGQVKLDFDDEIVAGCCVNHEIDANLRV